MGIREIMKKMKIREIMKTMKIEANAPRSSHRYLSHPDLWGRFVT
jgi:hypothetical protein